MTRATQSEPRIKLKRSEKIFTGLGLTMVIVSSGIWFFTEALAPDFTKPSWDIASPGLTLLTFLVGLFLVLRGMKRLINASVSQLDNSLESFVVYRMSRWIFIKTLLLVLHVLEFVFSSIGRSTPGADNTNDTRKDGAWDVASDHFYDKKPPPPFS